MLAHGAVLRKNLFSAEQVEAIMRDYRAAGLPPAEVTMMAFAEKMTLHAYQITADDVQGLKAHGFSDEEILDIALVAAARNFFSKTLDALGAELDPELLAQEPELSRALVKGPSSESS